MSRVYEIYRDFDDLYNSFFRGNEIEFLYQGKHYYILPHFDNRVVKGVILGEAYSEEEVQCLSKDALYNARIENSILGDVIPYVEIIWNNI